MLTVRIPEEKADWKI